MNNIQIAKELVAIARDISPEVDEWQTKFPYELIDKLDTEYNSLNRWYRDLRQSNPDAASLLNDALKSMVTLLARLKRSAESLYLTASHRPVAGADMGSVIAMAISRLERLQDEFTAVRDKMKRSREPVIRNTVKKLNVALDAFKDVMSKMVSVEASV